MKSMILAGLYFQKISRNSAERRKVFPVFGLDVIKYKDEHL